MLRLLSFFRDVSFSLESSLHEAFSCFHQHQLLFGDSSLKILIVSFVFKSPKNFLSVFLYFFSSSIFSHSLSLLEAFKWHTASPVQAQRRERLESNPLKGITSRQPLWRPPSWSIMKIPKLVFKGALNQLHLVIGTVIWTESQLFPLRWPRWTDY